MHPFSISFEASDNIFIKILTVLAALFIAWTWFYHQNHRLIAVRIGGAIIGGVASYFVALMFFGILGSFYTTIKDELNPNTQTATIVNYDKFTSTSRDSNRRTITRRTRTNTFYAPTLEYRDKNGNMRQAKGDVSFSKNNQKPIGSVVSVIVEDNKVRMKETPIKTFAFVLNIVTIIFMFMFYFVFYTFAKTGGFDGAFNVMGFLFIFILFPIAFVVLIFLFLNIGYEYFILGLRHTSFGSAAFLTGLGVFLLLCLYGYFKHFAEQSAKRKRKRLKKLEKKLQKEREISQSIQH